MLQLLHQHLGLFRQRCTTLLAERKVVQGTAGRTDDAATRAATFRTIGLITDQTGSAIRTDVLAGVMMAHLAEVCVRIHLSTAVRTHGLTNGLATLCTEHRLGFIDGSAIGARLSPCLTLLLLHHHGLVFTGHFHFSLQRLRTGRTLRTLYVKFVVVHHTSSNNCCKVTNFF